MFYFASSKNKTKTKKNLKTWWFFFKCYGSISISIFGNLKMVISKQNMDKSIYIFFVFFLNFYIELKKYKKIICKCKNIIVILNSLFFLHISIYSECDLFLRIFKSNWTLVIIQVGAPHYPLSCLQSFFPKHL